MSFSSPIFSIVIPTYNRAHLIASTIESVLEQNFRDFEVLIIDDGSNDNTEDVVNKFKNESIRYYKKENAERGAARNFGATRAKGQYINFFDSDDLMYPHHLIAAYNLIQSLERPEFFHLAYDHKHEDGTFLGNSQLPGDAVKYVILFEIGRAHV